MAEKVHPSAKPTAQPPPTTTAVNGAPKPSIPLPPTKAQQFTRPVYRPKPLPKPRRSCCRCCCILTTVIIVILLLLAAISGSVFWLLYHPHRPYFTVSSIKISQFNLSSTEYTSKFNFTITARNPNKKIKFFYRPIQISAFSNGIDIAGGSLPEFTLDKKNTTLLQTVLVGPDLGSGDISTLQSDLKKNKNNLPLKIRMDTKMQAKIGSLKTKKIRFRVTCKGAELRVPGGKTAASVATTNVKCKVQLRVKIWKWTI